MSEALEKYGDKREKMGEKRGEKRGETRGIKLGEKRGEKRGGMNTRISDVQSLMDTTKWTLDQVLDALKITEQKERQSIIKAVQG